MTARGPRPLGISLALVLALGEVARAGEDPVVPPKERTHVLTLALAIEESLAFDPRVGVEAESVRQAEAEVQTASQPPNPSVSFSRGLIPLGNAFTPELPGGPTQLDVELSFPLDWIVFGKRGKAVDSARVGLAQARAAFEDVLRQRRSEVAVAFVDVLEAIDLLELARQDTTDLERIQAIAQERVAVGGAPALEVDRTAVAVLEARREVRRRDAALRAARVSLATSLGRTGADAEFEVQGDLGIGLARPLPDLPALLSAAEKARPDILARRQAVEKAAADLHLAQRSAWPQLTSRVAYSRQYQESLGFPDATSYGIGLGLALPLFDRNQGGVSRAASGQAQAQLALHAALVALHGEVQQAAGEYAVTREAALSEDRAQLEAAQRVRERVQKAYELGGRPLLEVLDAQRVYREAARQSTSGRAAFLRATHRLNAAIGQEVVP